MIATSRSCLVSLGTVGTVGYRFVRHKRSPRRSLLVLVQVVQLGLQRERGVVESPRLQRPDQRIEQRPALVTLR